MAKSTAIATVTSTPGQITQPVTTKGVQAMIIVPPAQVAVYDDIDVVDAGPQKIEDKRELPILRILQPQSPQVLPADEGGVAGARPGDIYNIATGEVFSGKLGLFCSFVRTHRAVVEYVARDKNGKGGGFLNVYEPENPIVKKAEQRYREAKGLDPQRRIFAKIPNGFTTDEWAGGSGKPIELVDSRYCDGLFTVPNEDGSFPGHFGYTFRGSFAFQSSFMRAWDSWDTRRKNWTYPVMLNGRVQQKEAVMWATLVHLRTGISPKSDGSLKWYVPQISLAARKEDGTEDDHKASRLLRTLFDADGKPFDNPLYVAAVDLNAEIQEGAVTLDFKADKGFDDESTGGQRPTASDEDKEIPFE